jgi:acylphosphatase
VARSRYTAVMLVARRLRVRGRVQGVGFRYFVAEKARSEGVVGWVRNCSDGSVETLLEGDAEALTRMERFVRRGPPLSRVDVVEVEDEPAAGRHTGFRIEA